MTSLRCARCGSCRLEYCSSRRQSAIGREAQVHDSPFSRFHVQSAIRGGDSTHGQYLPAEKRYQLVLPRASGKILTSFNRFVSGKAFMNSKTVPFSIHSDTTIRVCEVFLAPTNGNRFGCLNCFHRTVSRQNLYPILNGSRHVVNEHAGRTFSRPTRSVHKCARTTLIATGEPRSVPRHTSAKPPILTG